ncbi:MAG: YegP family protein [Candidatus Thiodiazotropha lotti]|nr:YegP family protein [Candidatus Thiodiazotropha lotti]
MPGKFELYKDKKGEFRFRLKATNGQIILTSQGYTAKPNAFKGIASVQKNSQSEARFDKKKTRAGFRFNLMAINGRVVGTSETYKTEKARDNGIASTMKNARGAKIVDLTVG